MKGCFAELFTALFKPRFNSLDLPFIIFIFGIEATIGGFALIAWAIGLLHIPHLMELVIAVLSIPALLFCAWWISLADLPEASAKYQAVLGISHFGNCVAITWGAALALHSNLVQAWFFGLTSVLVLLPLTCHHFVLFYRRLGGPSSTLPPGGSPSGAAIQ